VAWPAVVGVREEEDAGGVMAEGASKAESPCAGAARGPTWGRAGAASGVSIGTGGDMSGIVAFHLRAPLSY